MRKKYFNFTEKMSKDVVEHYKKKLLRNVEDSEKVLYCLKKLDSAPVTIEILQDTEVGKVVNRLRKNSEATKEVIEASRSLVEKWKEFVKKSEESETGVSEVRKTFFIIF